MQHRASLSRKCAPPWRRGRQDAEAGAGHTAADGGPRGLEIHRVLSGQAGMPAPLDVRAAIGATVSSALPASAGLAGIAQAIGLETHAICAFSFGEPIVEFHDDGVLRRCGIGALLVIVDDLAGPILIAAPCCFPSRARRGRNVRGARRTASTKSGPLSDSRIAPTSPARGTSSARRTARPARRAAWRRSTCPRTRQGGPCRRRSAPARGHPAAVLAQRCWRWPPAPRDGRPGPADPTLGRKPWMSCFGEPRPRPFRACGRTLACEAPRPIEGDAARASWFSRAGQAYRSRARSWARRHAPARLSKARSASRISASKGSGRRRDRRGKRPSARRRNMRGRPGFVLNSAPASGSERAPWPRVRRRATKKFASPRPKSPRSHRRARRS